MKKFMRSVGCLIVLMGLLANVGFAAEMKKIVFVDQLNVHLITQQMLDGLEQVGLVDQQNVTIVRVSATAKDDPAQVVANIQEIGPDVVLENTGLRDILAALNGLSIPVVARVNVEAFLEEDGTPKANITGVYTTLKDMMYNSYKFLQKIAPLEPGQQVVFLDNPEFPIIPKDLVVDALERLQIPLKAVVNVAALEDWQDAVLKYSNDPEVGWILRSSPMRKRDGSGVDSMLEVYPWQREHFKKPTITYWEFPVQAGTLCAFGIDTAEVGVQSAEMVARILQGEDVRSVKAEYPRKVSIALNRKIATELGLVFSLDVLNLANVIYDDYEGKQVIRK